MFKFIDRFLTARSRPFILMLVVALIVLIVTADYWTGTDVGVSFFYLIPVAVVTWYVRSSSGYVTCLACATAWVAVDLSAGNGGYTHPAVAYWNAGIRLGFFMTTTHLLSVLKGSLQAEKELARIDELTQLYNARAFKELTRRQISLAQRHKHPLVLAYVDVDNFKQINDRFGHAEGDAVLRMVGATVRSTMRDSDILGRIGGDEFVIALPETELAAAHDIFAKLHRELTRQSKLARWPIGFSIGVAVFTQPPPDLEVALSFADRLMYRVKQANKNNVVVEECA